MDTAEILKALCGADGVSGDEYEACEAAAKLLKEFTNDVKTDRSGCVTAFIGSKDDSRPVLMLEAHIDEIGFIVTYIDDKGFLKVGSCGGTDRRLYPAQTVTVHSGGRRLKGVVCTLPPHVHADTDKALRTEDISIDTGFTSREEAEKYISPGDRITIDAPFEMLSGTRCTSKALDDRAGAAAVIHALGLIKDKPSMFNIEVLFASQEEGGSRGAKPAAYRSAASLAIATDVSFAYTPDDRKEDCGVMGKGVMIGISPVLDRALTNELKKTAEDFKIPFQPEVMGSSTGTDADHISVTRGGIPTALLSIPIKHMHTPVEIADIKDIEAVGELMARFILGGGKNV